MLNKVKYQLMNISWYMKVENILKHALSTFNGAKKKKTHLTRHRNRDPLTKKKWFLTTSEHDISFKKNIYRYLSRYSITILISFFIAFVNLLGFGVPFSKGGRPRFFGFLQLLSSGSSNSSSSTRRRLLRPFFRTSSSTSSRLPSSIAWTTSQTTDDDGTTKLNSVTELR